MFTYLAAIWNRVTSWFDYYFWKAADFFNNALWRVYEVTIYWYWEIRTVAIDWRNSLWFLVGTAYWYIWWLVFTGYNALYSFVGYWYSELLRFLTSERFQILNFLLYDLPVIRDRLLKIAGYIYEVCYVWYDRLRIILQIDLVNIITAWNNLRSSVYNFFTYEWPKFYQTLLDLPGQIAYLRTEVFNRLGFYLDPKVIGFIANLINNPLQPVQIVISFAILTPLNDLLTHLWYPHSPHDGE